MGKAMKIARRGFLLGSAAVAGGLVVGYYYYKQPYENPLLAERQPGEHVFTPYVKIANDNTITIIVPRAEMGQGVLTTLAALVAEELEVGLDRVVIDNTLVSHAYFNEAIVREAAPFPPHDKSTFAEIHRDISAAVAKIIGMQGTGGSSSVIDAFDKMRQAGAATRHVLLRAASEHFNKPATALQVADASIFDPESGGRVTYGELAEAASAFALPEEIQLKDRAAWKLLGKSQPRVDLHDKVTGKARFGIDIQMEGMVYAAVRTNPYLGGEMVSFDATAAKAMPGVIKVVDIGNGLGVIADNTWHAFQAADAVEVNWGKGDYPETSEGILQLYRAALDEPADHALRDDGNAKQELQNAAATAGKLLQAEYHVPFLAHACMEPLNTTVYLRDDGELHIWAGHQTPTFLPHVAAREAGVDKSKVKVHAELMGGGFGRRNDVDVAALACRLAKAMPGRPIKMTYSREEDMRHDAYRPACLARFEAAVGRDGLPSAIAADIAGPSIVQSFIDRIYPGYFQPGPDRLITEGAFDHPMQLANYYVGGHTIDLSIPTGFWRSVGNSCNGFFVESFLDEIAHAGGIDPLDLRFKLLGHFPEARRLLEKAAEMSSWGTPLAKGEGRGLAVMFTFGTWVAEVVRVKLDDAGAVMVEQIDCVCDAGPALDPSIIEAQMQSGIIFGLSAAISQEITFENGAVVEGNFDDYDALRIDRTPPINVVILQNKPQISGVGEPSTPPIAAALGNAIFAATGKRLRRLPMSKDIEFA